MVCNQVCNNVVFLFYIFSGSIHAAQLASIHPAHILYNNLAHFSPSRFDLSLPPPRIGHTTKLIKTHIYQNTKILSSLGQILDRAIFTLPTGAGRRSWGTIVLSWEHTERSRTIPSFRKKKRVELVLKNIGTICKGTERKLLEKNV